MSYLAKEYTPGSWRHWRTAPHLELLAKDGQSVPYCLSLRPESPYGRGALDLAIETAFIKAARLDCTGRQDFIVSVAG
jgi:hypothetical protein